MTSVRDPYDPLRLPCDHVLTACREMESISHVWSLKGPFAGMAPAPRVTSPPARPLGQPPQPPGISGNTVSRLQALELHQGLAGVFDR